MITDTENNKNKDGATRNFTAFQVAFKRALFAKGYTLEKLSEISGIPLGTLSNYNSGINKPRAENRRTLQRVLELPDAAFLADEPKRLLSQTRLAEIEAMFPPTNAHVLRETPARIRMVPVVSWATAGEACSYEDLANQIDEQVETDCPDQNSFSIIIEGTSMMPRYEPGDRIVFAPNFYPRPGDPVVVKHNDGRVWFKYYHESGPNGETLRLVSENKEHQDILLPRAEVRFVYPMWEMKRKNRR